MLTGICLNLRAICGPVSKATITRLLRYLLISRRNRLAGAEVLTQTKLRWKVFEAI